LRVKSLIIHNPKEALDFLFSFSRNAGVSAIVFDEISTLINRFGLLKPFRGMGGTKAVAEFLKSLLDTYDLSVIMLDTSINSLIELFYDYSSPLFREFDARIFIEPLGFESSLELLNILLSKRGLTLNDELKLKIVEFSGGVPQYLKIISSILRDYNSEEELLEDLERELKNGLLSDYFQALLEKFPTNEQEVLFAIAKGLTRFYEIDREVINAAQALESLTKKGIVIRIEKSRKNVRYLIRDKLFATWLAIQEMPRYRRMSLRRAKLFYLGLESIIREIFLTLQKEIEIVDALGDRIMITPTKDVIRYEGALGEIDMIAIATDGRTYIAEVYGGIKCKKEKINELLRNIAIAEKLGYKNIIGFLITYFDPPKEVIDEIKSLKEAGVKIYLLTYRELMKISKYSLIRLY